MKVMIISWIAFISIWSFASMGYDKAQAKRKGRRVPEKNLWLLAIVGGGIGAYLGMMTFNHKTRHTAFRIGFLLLAAIYIGLIIYLLGFDLLGTEKA
ncbi:hypothetical protein SLU01_05600 [Sporosarcina luteola]|uniref:DUF1294 domain-containing protein n=1 Tax=Sporosarcina luteola TaxID=582850 RepID=A0A511Z469_9BACL|nr:DUF1294 domain-containing protein [Sporosarcina luteola]GEN82248.1 hypothetical protein SLU01_05600 [Sporosarcina luteola]